MVILENIDIGIDIDKAILQNIDIDKISNRFKFGISNRASLTSPTALFFGLNLWTFEFMPACNKYELIRTPSAGEPHLMSKTKSFPDGPSDGVTHSRVPA